MAWERSKGTTLVSISIAIIIIIIITVFQVKAARALLLFSLLALFLPSFSQPFSILTIQSYRSHDRACEDQQAQSV